MAEVSEMPRRIKGYTSDIEELLVEEKDIVFSESLSYFKVACQKMKIY